MKMLGYHFSTVTIQHFRLKNEPIIFSLLVFENYTSNEKQKTGDSF